MNSKELELRVSAQTADGVTIGLIEYLPASSTKADLDARIDMQVEIMSRQRAKTILSNEYQLLSREEAQLEAQIKHRDEQTAKNSLEKNNRQSGKPSASATAALQNIEQQIENLKNNIEARKLGIASLEKLTG